MIAVLIMFPFQRHEERKENKINKMRGETNQSNSEKPTKTLIHNGVDLPEWRQNDARHYCPKQC